MRPLRLDMAGFTVFRDETTVDFTDADYFALVGPTGSGKSTVLDGICFALYGTVPRWGGARGIVNALAPSADRGPGPAGLRVGRLPVRGDPGGAPRRPGQRQDGRRRPAADAARLRRDPAGHRDEPGRPGRGAGRHARPRWTGRSSTRSACRTSSSPAAWSCRRASSPTSCTPSRPPGSRSWSTCSACTSTRRCRPRASTRATKAEAQLATIDQLLESLADADDEAVEAAEQQLTRDARADRRGRAGGAAAARGPGPRGRAGRGPRRAGRRAGGAGRGAHAGRQRRGGRRGRPPPGPSADARPARRCALAEEREEKVRGELAAAGDAGSLGLLLDRHTELRPADRPGRVVRRRRSRWPRWSSRTRVAAADLARGRARRRRAAAGAGPAGLRRGADPGPGGRAAGAPDRRRRLPGLRAAGRRRCRRCRQGSAVQAAEATGKAARAAADVAEVGVQAARRGGPRAGTRPGTQARPARAAPVPAGRGDAPRWPTRPGVDGAAAPAGRAGPAAEAAGRGGRGGARGPRGSSARAQRAVARRRGAAADGVAVLRRRPRRGRPGSRPPPADRDDLAAAWATLVDWAAAERDRRQAEPGPRPTRRWPRRTTRRSGGRTTPIVALFTAAGPDAAGRPRRTPI